MRKKGFRLMKKPKRKKNPHVCVRFGGHERARVEHTRTDDSRQAGDEPFFYSRSYRVEGLEMKTWAVAPRASREVIFFSF